MRTISTLFKDFIVCHEGLINRLLHIIGLGIILFGLIEKNITTLLVGVVIQEAAHFYQYWKSGQLKHSPLACFKPQLLFAYPLLAIAILYVLFFLSFDPKCWTPGRLRIGLPAMSTA